VEQKRYRPLNPEQLPELLTRLAQQDIHYPAAAGLPDENPVTFSGPHGIELQSRYDPQQRTFEVAILRKPFLIPASHIWTRVAEAMAPFGEAD